MDYSLLMSIRKTQYKKEEEKIEDLNNSNDLAKGNKKEKEDDRLKR